MSGQAIDYLVVGSGCSGAMAAQTLIEAGMNVTMLDVGASNPAYTSLVPEGDYLKLRKSDHDQHHYFIGADASGVVWGDIGKGAQITPPRKHMVEYVERLLPVLSGTFSPVESLGYGGLGIGWGLQCWEYSDGDLAAAGLDIPAMRQAYEVVSQRIGISATQDEAARYTLGELRTFQPSLAMDRNHRLIQTKYERKKATLQKAGLHLGRTPLALLSENLGTRKKYAYRDMDFYHDNDQSAWRPWMTIDALRQRPNFTYVAGYLVLRFTEKREYTEVECLRVATGERQRFCCRHLLLATGALGSARIVLRSFPEIKRLPLLCNPYTYIPCLQPALLGKAAEPRKLGFAQLSLFLDPWQTNFDVSIASLYSYQSLMLFRIIRQAPLAFREARTIMRYLMPAFEIMGVHHPDAPSPAKFMELKRDKHRPTGDALQVTYQLSAEDKRRFGSREKRFMKTMRQLGTYPIKRINPGYGSSIHYAGTLPFSQRERAGTLDDTGRLHGTRRVFVADSSGFQYLPARGLTFSLLANAHITAERSMEKHG